MTQRFWAHHTNQISDLVFQTTLSVVSCFILRKIKHKTASQKIIQCDTTRQKVLFALKDERNETCFLCCVCKMLLTVWIKHPSVCLFVWLACLILSACMPVCLYVSVATHVKSPDLFLFSQFSRCYVSTSNCWRLSGINWAIVMFSADSSTNLLSPQRVSNLGYAGIVRLQPHTFPSATTSTSATTM